MVKRLAFNRWTRILGVLIGSFLSAAALNLFITPLGLYGGGVMGLSQVIRTLLGYAGITAPFDLAGLIYLGFNVPLMVLAWKSLGRGFVIRMMICVVSNSLFISVIPQRLIVDDMLLNILLGGILQGFACGLILTCGGSTGGTDVIGMYLTKKGKGSVGRIGITFNVVLYTACALLFSLPVALYSAVYSVFGSLFVDKFHQQNIAVEVLLFTKSDPKPLQDFILIDLERGVTSWMGQGAYTKSDVNVLCVCLSKYEVSLLIQAAKELDPDAFYIINEGVYTQGNYERHLQ